MNFTKLISKENNNLCFLFQINKPHQKKTRIILLFLSFFVRLNVMKQKATYNNTKIWILDFRKRFILQI